MVAVARHVSLNRDTPYDITIISDVDGRGRKVGPITCRYLPDDPACAYERLQGERTSRQGANDRAMARILAARCKYELKTKQFGLFESRQLVDLVAGGRDPCSALAEVS
jgi:hypothetical protein